MVDETEEFLKNPDKKLVKAPRSGQILMARQVATTIDKGGVTFVEAPVGTGKSYAYLVPAALSKGRVVVATAKKSLQDQLIDQDIPAVKAATKKSFSFTVLKGASNYFCQARADGLKDVSAKYAIDEWQMTLGDVVSNGDVASFPGGYPDFWPQVNVDECDADKCRHKKECGYVKAVKAAQEAHIVVTNHHVLAHALLRESNVLGTYENLVLDEAHQFPEALRSAQTRELSKAGLAALHRRYSEAGGTQPFRVLETAWVALEGALSGIDGVFPPEFIGAEVAELQRLLAVMSSELKNSTAVDGRYADTAKLAIEIAQKARTKSFTDSALRLSDALELMTNTARSKDLINAVSTTDFKSATREVTIKPVTPGNAVRAQLSRIPAVIATSGTMSVGGSFSHIAIEAGLMPPAAENSKSTCLVCTTPFNYSRQAVLYTPKHLPKPVSGKGEDRAAWIHAIGLEIKRLVEVANGNTLVLFSANADLTEVHRKLGDLGLSHPIVAQRPGRAAEAEALYRETDNAVLLGSKSFFEGLNITGDKLWSVIIPRLPFPVPSDPVIATKTQRLEARYAERGMNPAGARVQAFNSICVPPMLFDTIQGAGRLIRTTTDRGVLSILDPRLWTGSGSRLPRADQLEYKGYGATVIEALGFPRRTSRFENVETYFKSLRAQPCPSNT